MQHDLQFQRFDEILSTLTEALPNVNANNIMVAGGAVRDTLIGLEPRDFDVYVRLGEKSSSRVAKLLGETPFQFLRGIRDAIGEEFGITHEVKNLISTDVLKEVVQRPSVAVLANICPLETPETPWFRRWFNRKTKKDHDPVSLGYGKTVQVICYTDSDSFESLLYEFDLDICQYGYCNGSLLTVDTTPDFATLERKLNGEEPVRVVNPRSCPYTVARLEKFNARFGCDIGMALSQLELVPKIDRTFYFEYEPDDLSESESVDVDEDISYDSLMRDLKKTLMA